MSSDALRAFRRNVVQVRLGLATLAQAEQRAQTERGQLHDATLLERFKPLAIPVRRALNPTDRVSAAAAIDLLRANALEHPNAGHAMDALARRWTELQAELDSTIAFGGSRLSRRQILGGFLGAAAFYDPLDREHAASAFIDEWGTAAAGLGSQLTEDAARVIVALDTLAASALGEPEILPPPEKTPPPPPDPPEPFWKRVRALLRPESND